MPDEKRVISCAALAIALGLALLHAPTPALACSGCNGLPASFSYDGAADVFVGSIAEVRIITVGDCPSCLHPQVVTVDVLERWKGAECPRYELLLYRLEKGMCGRNVAPGETQLVMLYPDSPEYGYQQWGSCTPFDQEAIDDIRAHYGPGEELVRVCDGARAALPAPRLSRILAEPSRVRGWLELRNPSAPPSPFNGYRRSLDLQDPGKPLSPYNGPVWKAGCS